MNRASPPAVIGYDLYRIFCWHAPWQYVVTLQCYGTETLTIDYPWTNPFSPHYRPSLVIDPSGASVTCPDLELDQCVLRVDDELGGGLLRQFEKRIARLEQEPEPEPEPELGDAPWFRGPDRHHDRAERRERDLAEAQRLREYLEHLGGQRRILPAWFASAKAERW